MSNDRPAKSYADQMGQHGGATATELVQLAHSGDVEAAKVILSNARHFLRPGGRWAKVAPENGHAIVEFLRTAFAEIILNEDANHALCVVRPSGGQRDSKARRRDEDTTRMVHDFVLKGRSKTKAVDRVAELGECDPSTIWKALKRAGGRFWRTLDWYVAADIESLVEEGASADSAVQQFASEWGFAESAVRKCLDSHLSASAE